MPVTARSIPRTALSARERAWRSRLCQLLSGQGFVRGSLQERYRVCGNPNCRCAKGQKHRGVYLVVCENGKYRQLYVPKALEAMARQWVENHREVRDLMDRVSRLYQDQLRPRQGPSPSSAASSNTAKKSSGSKD